MLWFYFLGFHFVNQTESCGHQTKIFKLTLPFNKNANENPNTAQIKHISISLFRKTYSRCDVLSGGCNFSFSENMTLKKG